MAGRPVDPKSKRQALLKARAASRAGRARTEAEQDFELLQTVAVLNGGLDAPASMSEIAREYKVTRQYIFKRVERLRERGWLERNDDGRRVWGVRLTHNGKLLIEVGLGAGIHE